MKLQHEPENSHLCSWALKTDPWNERNVKKGVVRLLFGVCRKQPKTVGSFYRFAPTGPIPYSRRSGPFVQYNHLFSFHNWLGAKTGTVLPELVLSRRIIFTVDFNSKWTNRIPRTSSSQTPGEITKRSINHLHTAHNGAAYCVFGGQEGAHLLLYTLERGRWFSPGRLCVRLHTQHQIADAHIVSATVFCEGDLKQWRSREFSSGCWFILQWQPFKKNSIYSILFPCHIYRIRRN